MGAVNYYSSDYITLGVPMYDAWDLENDPEFMAEIEEEVNEYGGTVDEAIRDYIEECYQCDYDNIEHELDKHYFRFYHIEIKPGYYEGFTLDIQSNFPVAFDGYLEKRDAQKEITEIKSFLLACADLGLVGVCPGWCTSYLDRAETIQAIKAAVQEMREEVRSTPTWLQYEREGA